MASYETARQDLILIERAEALARGESVSEVERYLINGLRFYDVGTCPCRDQLGRAIRNEPLSVASNVRTLPASIRQLVEAVLTAHSAEKPDRIKLVGKALASY
jgi:hypothetical protein